MYFAFAVLMLPAQVIVWTLIALFMIARAIYRWWRRRRELRAEQITQELPPVRTKRDATPGLDPWLGIH